MRFAWKSTGLTILLAAALMIGSVTASPAQTNQYWGVNFAGVVSNDVDFGFTGTDLEFDPGYKAGLVMGFPGTILFDRMELEGSFRTTDIDSLTASSGEGGEFDALGVLVNGYYDFGGGDFQPYVGGGLGWSRVEAEVITPVGPGGAGSPSVKDEDEALTYQLMTGVRWALSGSTAMTFGYRYTGTSGLEYQDILSARADIGGLEDHQVELGFQFAR